MIDEKKYMQYGFPRSIEDIKGITLHETGNYEKNAEQLVEWMNTECKTSQGTHYFCDKDKVVQAIPDDWAVYHTGKAKDWGNRYTIAIEVCSSFNDEDYRAAESRAISLIYSLQKKYNIPMDMIFFHHDFDSKKHCPNRMLDEYGTSKSFVYQRLED